MQSLLITFTIYSTLIRERSELDIDMRPLELLLAIKKSILTVAKYTMRNYVQLVKTNAL